MSRQFRHRATGLVLAALVVVAPMLAAGVAQAGASQAGPPESGRQVVFDGGGMLALSCSAEPDVRSIKVPADSTVKVVNGTGHGASLLLNGESHGEIANNGSTRVRRSHAAVRPGPL